MTRELEIAAYYRGPINLWVEDRLTKAYLQTVWQDDDKFTIHVGGRGESLSSLLEDAADSGVLNVFAYVDRDFRQSNRAAWTTGSSRRFVSSVLEVENLLLDEDALVGCRLNTKHVARQYLADQLRQRAAEMAACVACRRLLTAVRDERLQNFPSHPSPADVPSSDAAEEFIRNQADLVAQPGRVSNCDELIERFKSLHQAAEADVATGAWKAEFPGKELFRFARGLVYQPGPGGTHSQGGHDVDLAKAVGEWQVANNKPPAELIELRDALKARVLPPNS